MQNRQSRFRIGWILLTIAIINGIFWTGFRWNYENHQRVAQLTVDYDDTNVLADAYGITFPALLEKLKENGISSVGLYDLALNNLAANGRVTLMTRQEATQVFPAVNWRGPNSGYGMLVLFNEGDQALFDQVYAHLQDQQLPGLPPLVVSAGVGKALLIPNSKQILNDANMGFDPLQVQQVHDAGLTVTARLSNTLNLTLPRMKSILDDVQATGAKVVIFAEDEVMGYSTMIRPVAQEMRKRGLLFGNIEFSKQRGWQGFSGITGGQLVRVHSVGPDESSKAVAQTLIDRYSLAIKERDMRVAYIRLLRQAKGEIGRSPEQPGAFITKSSALDQNLDFIKGIKSELEKQPTPFAWLRPGMELGTAQPFGDYPMDQLTSMTGSESAARVLRYLGLYLAGLGVVGATLLMLNLFFDLSPASERKWLLAGLLLAILMLVLDAASARAHSGAPTNGLIRVLGMWPQRMGVKLMATEVGCLVPVIAILWGGLGRFWKGFGESPQMATKSSTDGTFKSTFIAGASVLLRTSFILAMGPLLIITLLNQWPFFSGADKFFFPKLTQLLPLALVAIACAGSFFPHRVLAESAAAARKRGAAFWKHIFNSPLTVSLTITGLVVLVVGMVWMARSGNDSGMSISSFELQFRQLLGNLLVTRPRTKEFLLGFPAMLFAVWFARRQRWTGACFAVIFATIGQADMVDSFMHLHTPIFYALARSIYALIIGIVGGGIVLWCCDRWVQRRAQVSTAPNVINKR